MGPQRTVLRQTFFFLATALTFHNPLCLIQNPTTTQLWQAVLSYVETIFYSPPHKLWLEEKL